MFVRYTVCFIVGSVLVLLVPLVVSAYYKWHRLTAKTTNYVVNGASKQVSTDQKHKNGTSNGTIKKENELNAAENGKAVSDEVIEKNGNKTLFSKLTGNQVTDLFGTKKATDTR